MSTLASQYLISECVQDINDHYPMFTLCNSQLQPRECSTQVYVAGYQPGVGSLSRT